MNVKNNKKRKLKIRPKFDVVFIGFSSTYSMLALKAIGQRQPSKSETIWKCRAIIIIKVLYGYKLYVSPTKSNMFDLCFIDIYIMQSSPKLRFILKMKKKQIRSMSSIKRLIGLSIIHIDVLFEFCVVIIAISWLR